MVVSIGYYSYTYAAGTMPNRVIEFQRVDNEPDSIRAIVSALYCGVWSVISEIPGHAINIEMMSNSDKIQTLLTRRNRIEFPGKSLAELSVQEQNDALTRLVPNGSWRIEITIGFGEDPYFEKVIRLSLFDPT